MPPPVVLVVECFILLRKKVNGMTQIWKRRAITGWAVGIWCALSVGSPTHSYSADPVEYLLVSGSTEKLSAVRESLDTANCTVVSELPQIGMLVVQSTDNQFLADFTKTNSGVKAIPNLEIQWTPNILSSDLSEEELELSESLESPPPNDEDDFLAFAQWGLDAIDAPEAWAVGATGAGVRVAVLDSGIDWSHPDLFDNLNPVVSESFVPGEPFYRTLPGFSHGTHVAGIIAASNNAIGTVGVAHEAEIIGIKVLRDSTGSGAFSWILAGILYAADNKADVINMSLGGEFSRRGGFFDPGTPDDKSDDIRLTRFIADIHHAFNRATSYAHQKGALIVASAGNDGVNGERDEDRLVLPRDAPHVISVSATAPEGWAKEFDATDLPASYSDTGSSVIDLAAPGGDFDYPGNEFCSVLIISPRPCFIFDGVISPGGYRSTPGGNRSIWSWATGTSMAAPHVSGVAALIISQSNGELPPSAVEAALRAGAVDLGKPGRDDAYGLGRVNAFLSTVSATRN